MLGKKHILDKSPDFKKKISNGSLVKGSSHLPGRKKYGLSPETFNARRQWSMLSSNEWGKSIIFTIRAPV